MSQSIRDQKLYAGRPKGNIGDQTIASALAALRVAAQSNDRMVLAEASRVAAHSCNVAEEYEQSLEHYERAIELFEGSGAGEQAARTRLGYMAALFTTGRYEAALEVADIAANWFRRNGDSMGLAKVEVNTGNLWYRREQHQKALQHHSRARELFEYLGEKYALAMTYLNMGNCYSCTRQLNDAARSYDLAEELSEQLGMKELTMQIRYNRAYLKFLQQQYGESIAAFGVVREYFDSTKSARHASLCDLDCAEIYLHLLNFPEAAKLARRAAAGFEKLNMSYEHAKAMAFLGMALLKSKEYTEGERVVGQSREMFEREGNERWVSMLDANLTQSKMQRAAPASNAATGLRSQETNAASVESLLTLIKNTRR